MSGFGDTPWGDGPYGDGDDSSFDLSGATPVDFRTVDLEFTANLGTEPANIALAVSPGTYSITPGLPVLAAVIVSSNTVRLFTLPQSAGALYRVEIVANLLDETGAVLGNRIATFTALAPPTKYIVDNLDARTVCSGKAVYLKWSNPTSPTATQVKIVRRLKSWPFDLTDEHDVVYEGIPIQEFTDSGIVMPIVSLAADVAKGATTIQVPSHVGLSVGDTVRIETLTGPKTYDLVVIQSFPDATHITFSTALKNAYKAGARVAKSSELLPQTYYYYLVLVSHDAGPTYTYDIDDLSRIFALSIAEFNGDLWWKNHATRYSLERDAKPASEGGGDGFLGKWFQVMGCWLNLMRGHMNAIALTNDPDQTPFNTLTAKNQSLGIDPEGFAYDLEIVRRPLTSLVFTYKRKGTCPGIIEAVRMFTKWDAECREFGMNDCAGGASTLKTWDGETPLEYGTEAVSGDFHTEVISPTGVAHITHSTKTWADSLWMNGTIFSFIGDVACTQDNVNNQLTTKAPRLVTALTEDVASGATSLPVGDTTLLYPGMTIQVTSAEETSPGSGVYYAEIVEVTDIDTIGRPGEISVQPDLVHSYPENSIVTIQKSIVRKEYRSLEGTFSGNTLTDAEGRWVEGQWIGFKLLGPDNVKRNITGNTGNTITYDGATLSATGAYAIAYDFTLGASWTLRAPLIKYRVFETPHSFIYEPTMDMEVRGTLYDPFNRMYGGPGLSLNGVFGPSDVGVYILSDILVAKGRASSATGAIFDLDPYQPAPAPDELVGMYLNPNQNQEQMFEILSNTSTTLTVAGSVESLVFPGQVYYVLKPRDRIRFQRLTNRLRKEFTDTDVRIHLMFV